MIRYGSQGIAVGRIQQLLLERGLLPRDAEREQEEERFGAVTDAAVRTFQAKSHLVPDGIVGPLTWAALEGAEEPEQVGMDPDYAGASILGERALRVAYGELGVREDSPGSNRGMKVDRYVRRYSYLLGTPWCGSFARWCWDQAAPGVLRGWGDLASALKWRDSAIDHGRFIEKPNPANVGVIMLPQRAVGAQPHGHVAIVARVLGDRVQTIEGNSGNRVASRLRMVVEFTGFVEVG